MTGARPYKGAIVISPPGALGSWAMQLIHDAAAECRPPLQVRLLDRQDDVDLAAAPHCIFLTQYPSASVLDVVTAGTLPVVAFIDEAADAVAHLMRTTPCGFLEALRLTTYAAAINPRLADGVSVRIVRRGPAASAARTIDDTVDHLTLPLSTAALLPLKRRFATANSLSESLEALSIKRAEGDSQNGDSQPDLNDEQLRTVATVLAPLIAMNGAERDATITWPSAVFLSGDRPNETAPLVADMTGAARIIYYGPYLYLPQGDWLAEITVGFSKEAVGSNFTIEAYSTELLARARFAATQTGLFSGSFRFSHQKAQDHLELQFWSAQGSIEGKFGLAWVKFSPADGSSGQSVE